MPDVASTFQMELHATGDDSLMFRSMSATEEISRLYCFRIQAVSENRDISADDMLGTPIAVSLEVSASSKRWFHGIVSRFGIAGVDRRYYRYEIEVRPSLWLLTRSANVRIFQDTSIPDIVKQVLAEHGCVVVDKLSGSYPSRGYCVQYRETDFDFVSRLLEDLGIFYYFQHSDSQHELVLADSASAHETVPGFETVDFVEDEGARGEREALNKWQMQHGVQSGKTALSSYNFKKPATDLKSDTPSSSRSHEKNELEVYDYDGRYKGKNVGDALAQIRLEEHESRFSRFSGAGNTPGLAAGSRFTLKDHDRDDQNTEYLVLGTRIEMVQAGYESGDAVRTQFHCSLSAQPYAEPYRPARLTPKPRVGGPQTALVVGDNGEGDIVTDEFGRIKVQFFWDREGAKNSDSSCWVRVATPWAGNGWGMITLPRIGQEVVVSFLEATRTSPLVTGSVYNAQQMPPYELPENASVSTIKSRSMLGSAEEFNELRFEDKAGSEYLLLQAQKDRLDFVEETLRTLIGREEHRTVKEDFKGKIEGAYHLGVTKGVKQKFGEKLSVDVTEGIMFKSGAVFSLKTAEDIALEAGTAVSVKSGTAMHLKVGTNLGADAGQNVHIKGGMNVVIEAGMQITLKAGGGSVVIGPATVAITGALVQINSGGSPGSGGGAKPVAPTAPEAPEDPELPEDPLSHR